MRFGDHCITMLMVWKRVGLQRESGLGLLTGLSAFACGLSSPRTFVLGTFSAVPSGLVSVTEVVYISGTSTVPGLLSAVPSGLFAIHL